MQSQHPHFFIVGAPKSGTTAMYEYLRAHRELYLPERKELRYFGADLEIRDRPRLTHEDFLRFFRDAPAGSLIGTAYVWYLFSTTAAREIAEFNPEAKIIVMLRNPVDMLPALHSEHLANGNEDLADFAEALAAEPDRRSGRRIPSHSHLPQGLHYRSVPRYTGQLRRYFDAFGRENVHVAIFDDLAQDPNSVYAQILHFLGVKPHSGPSSFDVINANRKVRSERLRHFLARPPNVPRKVIRALVPARLRRGLYERAKAANVVYVPREPIDPRLRAQLQREFAGEVEQLSELLGRDLSHWSAVRSG
jgi:hypothetical protein